MGSFSDSIKTNVDRVVSEMDEKCYKVAYKLFMAVVEYSPTEEVNAGGRTAYHSKGLFINNWFGAANIISNSTRTITDSYGIDSRNEILNLENLKTFLGKDGYLSFANNLSYAVNVEYDGWERPRWSGLIAPYAPIRNAIMSIKE